ncbi:MAG TPA: hypothetical protein VH877_19455 [Polyangia bacterium]|nr:hypothetical protein [Polyangia bacterium]
MRQHPLTLAGAASFTIDPGARVLETRVYDRDDLAAWQQGILEIDLSDGNGHGTAILSILYDRIQPRLEVEFYLAKILDPGIKGSSLCLLEALEWLVESASPHLINLSLGTTSTALCDPLQDLVSRAAEQGITVYASAGAVPSLPAQLTSVIAVADRGLVPRADPRVKMDQVVTSETVRLYAQDRWCDVPMSTSYACAVAVAEAARSRFPDASTRPR